MAIQIKAAPFLPNVARHFNGKTVTAVKVVLGTGLTLGAELGPNGVVQDVYEVLSENATPIIIGQIVDLATGEFDVYFEGDFLEFNDYGTGSDSFILDLQNRIQALGATAAVRSADVTAVTGESTSAGVNVASATVAAVVTVADTTVGTAGLVGDGGVVVS
jgi:hypothetical protein